MTRTGSRNYASDEHFLSAIQSFGGEEYLAEHFPRILRLLYDTREWHKVTENETAETGGYTDTYRITEVSTTLKFGDKKVSVYAHSLMSMKESYPFLCLTG